MSDIPLAIGIDLGTTYSCVAMINPKGEPEAISTSSGVKVVPSRVLFTDNNILAGDAAIAAQNMWPPENTIFDSKRLIGRQFDDESVKSDRRLWPFTVVGRENRPFFQVRRNGRDETYSPETISAKILEMMKKVAENRTQRKVNRIVLTVPANFNMHQKLATKEAAKLAGLEVIRLVNEPTAAAIAYVIYNESNRIETVLVYDFGGGTLDVSVVKCTGNRTLEVVSTTGHAHLGGQDIDAKLMEYVMSQYKNGPFPRDSHKLHARLRDECRKAKHDLSHQNTGYVCLDSISSRDDDLRVEINREKFNELCGSIFQGTMDIIDNALGYAKKSVSDIDVVVLSGGSARIPMVQDLLKKKFGSTKLWSEINPDEIVACGAAIVAKDKFQINFNDIVALSIGKGMRHNLIEIVIPRGTKYPCEKYCTSIIAEDNQKSVTSAIYEGERKCTKANYKIGSISMDLSASIVRHGHELKTTFKIDGDGILHVTVLEVATGKSESIKIEYDGCPHKEIDIENVVNEAKRHEIEDKNFAERCDKANSFRAEIYKMKHNIEDCNSMNASVKDAAIGIIKRYIDWDEDLKSSISEYDNKLEDFNNEMRQYARLLN